MEKYEAISYIGKGNFGSITKIKRKTDGKILVWKELNYGIMSEKERNRIVQEVNILHELHHPNIVKYYDRIIDKKNTKLYIVMEYCPGGDLSQLIKHNRKVNQYFSEDIIWKIFAQVASALYACHTHKEGKILHRDIKPSNIFIDQENNIKLGDFGLSRILNQDISFAVSRVGTPYYMSPEQIDNIKYNEKSDIWSLGCFLYELVTLHPPFEAKTHLNLAKKIKSGKVDLIPNFYSKTLNEVITSLMNIDPNKRPNITEIIGIPEINLRIKEQKIKENLKKLKKMENLLRLRELNIKEKEEALIVKEKYLNEREKNISQREEHIKKQEEEFLKREKSKYNFKDLSITNGKFDVNNLKITKNNSFIMSNSFSYKNIHLNNEQSQNKNKNVFMNQKEKYFFNNNKDNVNITCKKKKECYSAINTNHNIKNDSIQNISYNNLNNKNDSTQNVTYNINNRSESTQNLSNNMHSIISEVNSNYMLYNPNNEEKNVNKYMGTSPNSRSIVYNYNNIQSQTRNNSNSIKIREQYQNNYSYDKDSKNNKCKIFKSNENNNDNNNKEYNKNYKDYIDKKFKQNINNKILKYKEKCINNEKAQSYNEKYKENIYNNHTINFNNAENKIYFKNTKNNVNSENEKLNNFQSERFIIKNYYNNININKCFSYKLNYSPKPFSKEKINYYNPETDYFNDFNRNIKLEKNLINSENEKVQNENINIHKKHKSFNESNVNKNYYRKSYNSKQVKKTSTKKGENNLNTINF